MDNPVDPPPDQYQVSLHSYLSPTAMRDPSSWADVGHAFISISKNGKIIGSAGLAPDQTDEEMNWRLGAPFWQSMGKGVRGKIYSEWNSLYHHTGQRGATEGEDVHTDQTLRTQSWDISPEQALQLMESVSDQRPSGAHPHRTYNLYTDNCSDWALNQLNGIGIDVSGLKNSSYVYLPRPGTFHSRLSDRGTGTLRIPAEAELNANVSGVDQQWLSREGGNTLAAMRVERERNRARQLEAQRLAPPPAPAPIIAPEPEVVDAQPSDQGKKKKTPSLGLGS